MCPGQETEQMEINNATLVERLQKLSSAVVSDVLDVCGYTEQSLSSAIRPLAPTMRFAGPAMCFSGVSETPGDTTPALSSYEIDQRIAPGMIVLIAANGHSVSSVVGGLMALSFTKKGCGGIVSDGGVRDVAEITALELPTFCRYASPLNSARRWKMTAAGSTIELPGQASPTVSVAPGDLVIGDADGVMVIPQGIASVVIAWTERLAAIEETIVAGLHAGALRDQVFAANPRFDHIRRLK
jgi:4-hydroxy-4-methyl-2-oxoglutarate aldolase